MCLFPIALEATKKAARCAPHQTSSNCQPEKPSPTCLEEVNETILKPATRSFQKHFWSELLEHALSLVERLCRDGRDEDAAKYKHALDGYALHLYECCRRAAKTSQRIMPTWTSTLKQQDLTLDTQVVQTGSQQQKPSRPGSRSQGELVRSQAPSPGSLRGVLRLPFATWQRPFAGSRRRLELPKPFPQVAGSLA